MRLFLLIFLLGHFSLSAVELIKESEINLISDAHFFLVDGKVVTFNKGEIGKYSKGKLIEKKTILKKGGGPGDFQIVQNIYSTKDGIYIWDRMLKRMNRFSKDWKFIGSKKIANAPTLTGFKGYHKSHNIFKWLEVRNGNGGRIVSEVIGNIGENKRSFVRVEGQFVAGTYINYDRPYLKSRLEGEYIYYADINSYKIYTVIPWAKCKKKLLISRDFDSVGWDDAVENLQWEILEKPEKLPAVKYPSNVPPVYDFAVDGDLIAVCTNRKVKEKICVVDLFKNGQYKGSVKVPILHSQYFIFPAIQQFPPDIYLKDNRLYTKHYDSENDEFTITTWQIKI